MNSSENASVHPDLASVYEQGHDASSVFEARTIAVDSVVASAFEESFGASFDETLAVAAVGGYGRRELFPYSDVDLLIVMPNHAEVAPVKDLLARFQSSLWDKGLRISHSTRSISDCCRFHPENLELHISLLDVRQVAGSQEVFQQLQSKLPDTYVRYGAAMISRLVKQSLQRHARFNNTPYHLEPNVKESPGGIRDIHLLRWLSQLQPGERLLREAMAGLQEVAPGIQEWLFSLRCFLHLRAGRDANLLTFEMQDEAARSLPSPPLLPEEWMRVYFQHARRVYQRSLRAMEFTAIREGSRLKQFLYRKRDDWKSRFASSEFVLVRDRVSLRDPQEVIGSPVQILRLFSLIANLGLRLSWEAQWALQQAATVLSESFLASPPPWNLWSDLLSQPYVGLAISEMQETGVLTAAIPQWTHIDGLVVRDFYHRYTVDEHTLVALREIDKLNQASDEQLERFERLAKEDGPSAELRLALLLHDLGKGTTPGDHLRGSRKAAREVMASMDVPDGRQQRVLFLIQHHLDLSIVMNGRDLEDPATARMLTSEIHTLEDLRRLTLLTFADISAVNPTAMSPWRLEQLWRVYLLGVQQLTRELASDRIHQPPTDFADDRSPRLREFLEGFPQRYLRTHTREQIARHVQLSSQARQQGVAVEITEESGTYLMTVLAHDKSGLFADLCGTLASFGMDIVKGEASSNSSHFILDEIRFSDPNRTLALNPEEIERLEATVQDVVAGSVEVNQLLKRRRPLRRPTRETTILPAVRFVNEASERSTLIDFIGEDRPGLLYDLATAIRAADCNIEVVMIDTEAHKAIDVFYVTHGGGKLDADAQDRLRKGLLIAAGLEHLKQQL